MRASQFGIVALALALSGCASTLNQTLNGETDKIGAFPLTNRNEVEKLDLAHIIREHFSLHGQGGEPFCKLSDRSTALNENDDAALGGLRLDQALGCFANFARSQPSNARTIRNQIQERILLASEQRCGDFKSHLQRSQSATSFWSGLLTSGFAAAGAITKSFEGARTLSGLSGFSSAYGAEYNQAYFSNLAAHVVVSGIDQHRAKIYEQIYASGQAQQISEYTLQAAIKDAFRYHAACSLMTGLIEAQDAIRMVDNPGLDTLRRVVVKNKQLQALNRAEPDDVPGIIEKWKDVSPPDRWLAGVPLVMSTRPVVSDTSAGPLLVQVRIVEAAAHVSQFDARLAGLEKDTASFAVKGSPAEVATKALRKALIAAVDAVKPKIKACDTPTLESAKQAISLAAKVAITTDSQERDKLDIDVKYQNAERQGLSASVDQFAARLNACANSAQAEINRLVGISKKPVAEHVAAIKNIVTAPQSCKDAAEMPYAAGCKATP